MSQIYNYITEQESQFSQEIPMEYGWYWNFKAHVRRSFLYKHSQFEKNNENRNVRPYKNIVRPILNIQYRTEGFDVKDIDIYVDNEDTYYKSFLVKKYYEKWALENTLDTFIDEVVESYVDYGGVLVKNIKGIRPEVVDLRTIAFCDQTDILSAPFAIKHNFTPSQLKRAAKSGGWDMNIVEYLITKSEAKKSIDKDTESVKTPGRYIEVYEIHNTAEMDIDYTSYNDEPMMWICGLYQDENGNPEGVTLFKSREPKSLFKFLKRDPIKGRALGWGGIEELFEPQVWTNYAEIHIAGMLEQASKILYLTTDPRFKGQNLSSKVNGEVLDLQPNTEMRQLDTQPRNLTVFDNYGVRMHEHAMEMGAASELALGKTPSSGTPFKSVESQLIEGNSLHLWRQGRIAVFIDEIHRDWIIPSLAKDITNGDKFLTELSADELMEVARAVGRNHKVSMFKKNIMDMDAEVLNMEDLENARATAEQVYVERGSKKFIDILREEMKDEKLDVRTNIAGKQKNLSLLTDKMVGTVRQFLATPEARQDPELVKWLNGIFENSGMSPITYSPKVSPIQPKGNASGEGLKELANSNKEK